MQEKEATSLQLFCCLFASLFSSQCQAPIDALLSHIYIINACKKKKRLSVFFDSVLGYFLFPQTVHILTWLNCYLNFITSATPNHMLSCQMLCSYPGVVGNVILFLPQHVIWFHLGWLSSAWSPCLYYMVWFLVHHSVSHHFQMRCTIPTRVLKLESNSRKDL